MNYLLRNMYRTLNCSVNILLFLFIYILKEYKYALWSFDIFVNKVSFVFDPLTAPKNDALVPDCDGNNFLPTLTDHLDMNLPSWVFAEICEGSKCYNHAWVIACIGCYNVPDIFCWLSNVSLEVIACVAGAWKKCRARKRAGSAKEGDMQWEKELLLPSRVSLPRVPYIFHAPAMQAMEVMVMDLGAWAFDIGMSLRHGASAIRVKVQNYFSLHTAQY